MSLYLGDKKMSVYVGDVLVSGGSGGNLYDFDAIIVGGGGGGAMIGGGGGGGEVLATTITDFCKEFSICIGAGGSAGLSSYQCGGDGGSTCIIGGRKTLESRGGCGGHTRQFSGGNRHGGDSGNGHKGGLGEESGTNWYGGGGAGSFGNGCNADGVNGGNGGPGLCGYGGGGGGGGGCYSGAKGVGCDGGGNGGWCISGSDKGPATAGVNGGGGGGGSGRSYNCGAKGGDGLVVICYKTDGSCGFSCATGGTKSTCGDYYVHCFTSDGTFCITG